MEGDREQNLTLLLRAVRDGDAAARDRLFALTYEDLRRIAASVRFVGRSGDTFQATALVNEAFLHFCRGIKDNDSAGRAEFFRAVAMAMRTILRDHWRYKNRQRRSPGPARAVDANDVADPDTVGDDLDLEALDQVMDRLEKYNRRWYDVVMARFYAARTIEETADALGLSITTVKSDWQLARGWLRRELTRSGP